MLATSGISQNALKLLVGRWEGHLTCKRRAAAQQSPETWPNMEQIDDDDDDDDDDVLGKYRLVNKNKKNFF